MTLDLSLTRAHRDAGTAVAAAVSRSLPVDTAPEQLTDQDLLPADLLPDVGSQAVSATVRGAWTGTLVVVLSAAAASGLTTGPLGSADLVAALEPALQGAAAVLTSLCGELVQVDAPYALAAELAVVPADGSAATRLMSPHGHVATVLLSAAEPEPGLRSIPAPRGRADAPHAFAPLPSGALPGPSASRPMELLHDVEMAVTVELGRTRMSVRDLLSLTPGSVVELDRAAGSPVDVLVNGTLIARGEVVVIDEEFGIRISEIVGVAPAGSASQPGTPRLG